VVAQHNDERLPLRQELSALPALTMPPLVVEEIVRALEVESRRTAHEIIDLTVSEVRIDSLVEAEYRGVRRRRSDTA